MTTDNQHLNDWLDALRSGEYEQGYGEMKIEQHRWNFTLDKESITGYKFCCLGVACEIADAPPSNAAAMPQWLMDYLGINEVDQSTLVSLNDGRQATFLQIANIVELAYVRKVPIENVARELYPLWYGEGYSDHDAGYNHEY